MPKLFNRIKETSTSIGTGDFVFGGVSAPDFFTFGSVLANNDQFLYEINHSGVAAEQGIGTYHSATNSFTRTTVKSGSNGTSPVNFAAGSKDVFVSYIAESAVMTDAANTFTVGPQTIQTGADGNVGAVVKGNSATQSADLQQWQKTSGNTRARVTKDGEFSNPKPNDCSGTLSEFFGLGAGAAMTTGATCTGFGWHVLTANLGGVDNSGFGCNVLSACLGGNSNSGFGKNTLNNLSSGSNNTAFGQGSGGTLQTGSANLLLGDSSNVATSGTANGTALGASAVCKANELALSPNTNFQTFYVLSSTSVLQPRADFTVSNVDNTNATRKYRIVVNVWDTTQHEAFRAEASGTAALISFFGAAAVAQQTDGAALTNNVTSGGTTDTIANFTDLTTYANDAAAIRNDIYQLARKMKIVDDALRAYGLLT